jgi:hypothetical protein
VMPTDSTKPGSAPICRQRIVSSISVDIVPEGAGTLLLRIDPRQLFSDVDFSMLSPTQEACGKVFTSGAPEYAFADDSSDQPSAILYQALHSAGALYQFSWSPPPH